MQEESRASLGYLSEALNFEFEHGSTSTSSNGLMIDHWDNNIHSLGDNDLHDYMTANSEPVYHGEASSSSGTKNEASSSHNEVIDLDSDSEQPSGPSQHVENVNLNAEYIELDSEDINPARDGAGSSVEGRRRRASCKRKALEGSSIDQSSSGGFHHGESSNSWTPASVDHRPGDGLNIFGSRRQVSGTVPFFPVSSNPSDQQETVNPAVFSAGTVVRQQHMSNLRLGQSSGNVFTQNSNPPPAISIPPVSRNILPPPFQWREVSSTSTVPVHLDETRPEHHPLFIPPPQLRSSRNATSGNLNIASSVPRTNSTTTGVVQPPSSSLAYQNLLQQQRRRSELARRSLISSTNQRGSPPPDGPVLHPGGDNSQTALQSFRALAAASRGRSRLTVSQMQNILGVMRRDPNHNLRIEDVMLLNQSVILDGAGGMHDRYRDMRLDVDNMSYEELLALEERIGDVCTGVNEETITNRLKQHKYTKAPQDAETSCCICQEEYSEGEDMGTLECGHDFHSLCVKEWLKQKNLCPICKMTGLNTAKKRKIG